MPVDFMQNGASLGFVAIHKAALRGDVTAYIEVHDVPGILGVVYPFEIKR